MFQGGMGRSRGMDRVVRRLDDYRLSSPDRMAPEKAARVTWTLGGGSGRVSGRARLQSCRLPRKHLRL